MKRKNILTYGLFALALTACNDSYNDQFDFLKDNTLSDVKKETILLTGNDYSTIAKDASNQSLATPEELASIEANKCFVDEMQAADLIPALLKNKFKTADEGSIITAQFALERAMPEYIADFTDKTISAYTLSEADYQTVWADKVQATYLTPATVGSIPSLLNIAKADAQEGDLCVAEYAFDNVEPSIGGSPIDDATNANPWTTLTINNWPAGSDWTFIKSGDVDLSAYAGKTVQIGFAYSSDGTNSNTSTWEIKDLVFYDEDGVELFNKKDSLTSEESFNAFTVEGTLPEGLSYVWSFGGAKYGAKASAYAGGTRYETKDIVLVSPEVLVGTDYTFNFQHACNFCTEVSNYLKVMVRVVDNNKKNTRAAYVKNNGAGLYRFNGSVWKEYTTSDATVAVVDPVTYTQTTTGYFDQPTAQLPAYLASTYPYASDEAQVGIVYKGQGGYAFAAYEYVSGAWAEPSKTILSELPFTLKNGEWSADMSTYYSSTLLGETGGMQVIDTYLGGDLSYVWTNTTNYGWKGTAYKSSTNMPAVSYLITPVIKLKGAKQPVLIFDEAYRYLNGLDNNEVLKVLISTDFVEDPLVATWTDVTPNSEERPEGNDWSFTTCRPISLDRWIGQKIVIAFRYESRDEAAPTWEIKNLSVKEYEEEEGDEE